MWWSRREALKQRVRDGGNTGEREGSTGEREGREGDSRREYRGEHRGAEGEYRGGEGSNYTAGTERGAPGKRGEHTAGTPGDEGVTPGNRCGG